ncbi:MAG: PAS domain S-box protein [Burkholderiales bacterium]
METTDRRMDAATFNSSPHLMAVVASDSMLKVVNAAWEKLLGYRSDEIVGRKLLRLVDDTDRATVLKLINSRMDAGARPIELNLRCKDGTYRAFEWEARRVAGEQTMFITGKDVTDKRKLEVTQNLKVYELYAEAARQRKLNEPSR